jgi:Zinc binding domain
MTDCYSTTESKAAHPKIHCCPNNGLEGTEVSAKTISHHLKQAWLWKDEGVRYFFCADPDCDVVYFGDDELIITKAQLRTTVGIKEKSNVAPACYCFGISKADAINDPSIREYVISQTRHAQCSCDVSNPSGRCCLKDFPHTGK